MSHDRLWSTGTPTACVRCLEMHDQLLCGEMPPWCNRCAHEVAEDRGERIATLERELAEARQMLKEQDGRTPMLDAMERVAGDVVALADAVVVAERDELKKQLAAVTAERDALGAERVMFCAVVDSLTRERDALLESSAEFRMLVQRYYDECGIADDCGIGERLIASLAPTPPTGKVSR